MDERVLVEVCIPAAQICFDAGISIHLQIIEVIELFREMLWEQAAGSNERSFDLLYDATSKQVLPLLIRVKDADILTGDQLMLF